MSVAELLRDAMVVVGAIPAIGFPFWYHLRMRWRETEMGRHVMGYSCVVAFAYFSALIHMFFKDYPFEWAVRLITAVGMTTVVWWRVIVFMHVRKLYRAAQEPSMSVRHSPAESEETPEVHP